MGDKGIQIMEWTPEMAAMSASISHPAAAALACAAIMLVMWALKK